jgi:hypothetical protein
MALPSDQSQPSPQQSEPPQTNHEDDDIWASDDSHHDFQPPAPDDSSSRPVGTSNSATSAPSRKKGEELLSDLPSLRRQHVTAGYREGLSVGKARVMQDGFDQGYPVGVQVGLRVGRVLGCLEGVVAAKKEGDSGKEEEEVKKLLMQARRELERGALLEDLDEEVVMRAVGVPERVEVVLRRWEGRVLGKERMGSLEVGAG